MHQYNPYTYITLQLPYTYISLQLPIIPEAQEIIPREIPKDCTVLIVEDNVSNYFLLVRLLGHLGIRCEWKTSGFEVVEFADNLPRIDLILMDIRLPYEDGYEAMRKIKSSGRFNSTPIVAVTAEGSMEQIHKAKNAGFNGFLGKPVDPDKFPDQILSLLFGDSVWDLNE